MAHSCVHLTILRTVGPLFVIDEIQNNADADQRERCLGFLTAHFPQMLKKSYGWMLSIEEVEYLSAHGQAMHVSISLMDEAHLQRECLCVDHAPACRVYSFLTTQLKFRLRHGSQFGALFIGYRDGMKHGENLFFLGPLSPLERIRADRIGVSVHKVAYECLCTELEVVVELIPTCVEKRTSRKRPRLAH